MNSNEIREGEKPFADPKNFPRGLGRSGDFSILEADLLRRYGATLKGLQEGALQPQNEVEQRFVDVFQQALNAESRLEKIWVKYLKCTTNKTFYTMFTSTTRHNNIEDDDDTYTAELEPN
ncbi:DUF413 domain-containing protein [Alteromonadaceae bacterium BrNp21-10]|nr:DUF413 domain-containing protein [Alteromonadaceae bacterium BrNp21-10]